VGGLVRYTVHAKPAYQPAYGLEVMTRPELVSQWVDCLVRPESRVLRVHLDPMTCQVIHPEERTLKQLTEEFVKYNTGFKPLYGLQVLESLLTGLQDLPPGRYLLSHARQSAFAQLAQVADSAAGGSNLHSSLPLRPDVALLSTPPCLSIDPSILTSFNLRFGRVPATFNYDRRPAVGEGGWKEYWEEMKKKGIKRKKKKGEKRQDSSSQAVPLDAGPPDSTPVKSIVKHVT